MKTIERYVFGAFMSSFTLAFLVLSFVLTISLMVQIAGYILQGVPIGLVGEFALVSFPETMQWTIPIALLVSSVLVFSRLSADSEIAAIRACGINLLTIMRWPLIFGFCCTLICLYINNEIVPRGHELRRNLAKRISVGNGIELIEPGKVIDDFPKVKFYCEAKEGNWLKDLVVLDYSEKDLVREVTAKKALVTNEGRDIILDLHDVTVDPIDAEHPGMAHAVRYRHRVKDALKDGNYKRKEKDWRFFEMISFINLAQKNMGSYTGSARIKGTQKYFAKRYLSKIKTEFMKRWVFAFASLSFIIIGVPLGIRAQRKESTIGMALSLAIALGYYLCVILMMSTCESFRIHPEYLIWLPVLICLALSSYLIPKNL